MYYILFDLLIDYLHISGLHGFCKCPTYWWFSFTFSYFWTIFWVSINSRVRYPLLDTIISIFSLSRLIDDRCVVSSCTDNKPQKLRDCLFKICPMNRYASQNNLQKSLSEGTSKITPDFLKRLQVSKCSVILSM